jgi:hypothetical protein
MEMPFITDLEEFKRHVCAWCTNLRCDERSAWEQRPDTRQIICFEFQCESLFRTKLGDG